MRIEINNFGPISFFEFDLNKDLHVIYGKNNIGKSYAISAIYVLLKKMLEEENSTLQKIVMWQFIKTTESSAPLDNIIDTIKIALDKKKSVHIDVTEAFESAVIDVLNYDFVPAINKSFKNSFENISNVQNKLSKEELSLSLFLGACNFTIKYSETSQFYISSLKLKKKVYCKFIKTNRKPHYDSESVTFYMKSDSVNLKVFRQTLANEFFYLIRTIFDETKEAINDIYFLPASRSGLYQAMSIFSTIFAKVSQWRGVAGDKIEIPALPEHVSDYFLKLSTAKTTIRNDIYTDIAANIERDLLDAQIIINPETKKIEYYNNKTGLTLDLSETSSMISEIAPIVAYLKYVINENQPPAEVFDYYIKEQEPKSGSKKLIIIEEPEAHLHPSVQVTLMEYFIKLIGCDIKIVMTTHSNYMFNKLGNLILANKINSNSVSSYLLEMTEIGSIANTNIMKADKHGIDDFNFSEISELLFEERMRLEGDFDGKN